MPCPGLAGCILVHNPTTPLHATTGLATLLDRSPRSAPEPRARALHLPAAHVATFVQDGIVEELGPHHCRLTLGSWSWTGLAATIGRFDTDIDVIGPPQLATAFADLAARYTRATHTTDQRSVRRGENEGEQ